MQVKRFVAANMRLALNMVREEIGPDAVILSNKRVAGGVELLTAIDGPEPDIAEHAAAQTASSNPFVSNDTASLRPVPTPSKLELEIEQMQLEAKQRAQALAASLARQNRQELDARAADLATASQSTVAVDQPASFEDALELTTQHQPLEIDKPQAVLPAAAVLPTAISAATATANEGELSQMRFELQSMRDLLERQLSNIAWGQFSQQQPQRASLWRRLKRMGISATVADTLLAKLNPVDEERNSWGHLMKGLATQLPVVNKDLIATGGVFAFVGPTGAGKTTTIGKLATRYVLEHGAEGVALVTTDTARIAAHEQLRTFGRILNVPVQVVDKNTSLERVLFSLRHKSLVLVDTAGLNKQDERLQQQVNSLNELGSRAQTVLVIPTTSQEAVIKAAYHTYKTDNLSSCVFTKLDETASLGESLSLVVEKQLPLAYTTNGQGIPDDIKSADNEELVGLAIELAKVVQVDDDSMADEISSLSRA